jgi:hypothetical protein
MKAKNWFQLRMIGVTPQKQDREQQVLLPVFVTGLRP